MPLIDDSDNFHYRSLVNEEGMLVSIGSFSMWINANDMIDRSNKKVY